MNRLSILKGDINMVRSINLKTHLQILFVCDDYPPYQRGGYEQLCQEVSQRLREKGHSVTVLSTIPDFKQNMKENEPVYRLLSKPVNLNSRLHGVFQYPIFFKYRQKRNEIILKQILQKESFQIIIFWPNIESDCNLMRFAENQREISTAYYLAGYTPTQPSIYELYWSFAGRNRVIRFIKALVKPILFSNIQKIDLSMTHVMCVSEFESNRVQGFGVKAHNITIVHNGIDIQKYQFLGLPSQRRCPGLLKILFMGRLTSTKGAHTAVEAVNILVKSGKKGFHLCLLGSGDEDYINDLEQSIRENHLEENVTRHNWIPREMVPEFMSEYDVLVLPTVHPEPLARAIQEAMAVGLIVAATPTGGTIECVKNLENSLTFSPDDASELAACLLRIYEDQPFCDRIAIQAKDFIKENFTIERTVNHFEAYLYQLVNQEVNDQVECECQKSY